MRTEMEKSNAMPGENRKAAEERAAAIRAADAKRTDESPDEYRSRLWEEHRWVAGSIVAGIMSQNKCGGIIYTHDDLVQEAEIALLHAAESYDSGSHNVAFSTYAYKVVKHKVIDLVRKDMRTEAKTADIDIDDISRLSYTPDYDDRISGSEFAEKLMKAVRENGSVPVRCGMKIFLARMNGLKMTNAEFAEKFGVSKSTVISWQTKCRAFVKQFMAENGYEEHIPGRKEKQADACVEPANDEETAAVQAGPETAIAAEEGPDIEQAVQDTGAEAAPAAVIIDIRVYEAMRRIRRAGNMVFSKTGRKRVQCSRITNPDAAGARASPSGHARDSPDARGTDMERYRRKVPEHIRPGTQQTGHAESLHGCQKPLSPMFGLSGR